MQEQHETVQQGEIREKKPYHAPTLAIYGDLGALTKNVDFAGSADGGTVFSQPLKT